MANPLATSVDLTPEPLLTISAHEGCISAIAYLPGEERFVTCSDDGTIRIWNVENGEQEGMAMEHDGPVWALAITRDGKMIQSGGDDRVLRVWDVETHQPMAEWGGHEAGIFSVDMSPDDQFVASGDFEGRIVIREMNLNEDGRIKHAIETDSGVTGTKLASGHDDNMIRVFDVENGDLVLGPIEGHTHYVLHVGWSLDGSQLFTASADYSIRFWDSETGQAIGDAWTGHTDYVNCIALSPDGAKLASASDDKTVRFWAQGSGDPIGAPLQHENWVQAFTLSPSGEFVACGEYSGKVSIWHVPWWDDSKEKVQKSLLDRPAVTVPRHSGVGRQLDYLNLPTIPSHARLRDAHATEEPSRTQVSAFPRKLWRTLSHLLFGRSHGQPRHAEVTTIYPGFAQPRVYVASRDGERTPDSRTEPLPTVPGHYPGFSIIVESVSSTDSHSVIQRTPAPPDNSEDVQASCCGLFSRRRARSGIASVSPTIELTEHAAPPSNPPVPRGVTLLHSTVQNVLDLPAVAESLRHTD
ncbi:WD40 repeat-like protein [Paxillus ammoniavirescens]|nr:WD40 repeat-like protein [Paxillus ammoniavirescens]